MALNFPSSPTANQIYFDATSGNRYIYDSTNSVWRNASNVTTMSISSTPPGSPSPGTMWWNQDYGRLFIYYSDTDSSQWVDAMPTYSMTPPFAQANAAYSVANAAFSTANSALQNTNVTLAGNLTSTGVVSDSKGDLRNLPLNTQTASYTLVIGDNGKMISTNNNITVPNTIFSPGNVISIFNNSSAANITVSNASSVTIYLGGTTNTATRYITYYGLATLVCVAANTFFISGAGVT